MVNSDSGEDMALLCNYHRSSGELNCGYQSRSCNTMKNANDSASETSDGHRSTWLKGHSRTVLLTIFIGFLFTTGTLILIKSNNFSSGNKGNNDDGHWNHLHSVASPLTGDAPHSEQLTRDLVSVATECGHYMGRKEESAFVFKGISYASPPTGALRWMPPTPIWNDSKFCDLKSIHKALEFGEPCFQINPRTKEYEGSENCLFLNIWTPQIDENAQLNVMVWIHGGFLQMGSGHQPGLRPSGRLAANLNTVFVSINYRLHALGFLDLSNHPDERWTELSGNFGIADQLVALEWVKKNIEKFSGNPESITVFGADAGGASILAHLTNPAARPLFSRAWLIGPSLYMSRPLSPIDRHIVSFINRTNCAHVQCLRKMPPENVLASFLGESDPSFRIIDQNDLPIIGIYPEQFIRIDGNLVRDSPPFNNSATLGNDFGQIPLLIGTAGQSIEIWPGIDQLNSWTWTQYEKYVTTSLDSFSLNLTELALSYYPTPTILSTIDTPTTGNLTLYSTSIDNNSWITDSNDREGSDVSPEFLYASMVSDIRQNCPISETFRMVSRKWTAPLYRYIHTASPSASIQVYDYKSRHSFHLWDLIAFFDSIPSFIDKPSESDLSFKDIIQNLVKNFTSASSDQTNLNATDSETGRFREKVAIVNNHNITLEDDYQKERCTLWSKRGLLSFVWIS